MKDRAIYVTNGQDFGGLAFSQDGTHLHVVVEDGTQLDTYNVHRKELVKSVGRGKTHAVVNSISSDGIYLACCSDRKTIHLFNIAEGVTQSQVITNSSHSSSSSRKDSLSSRKDSLEEAKSPEKAD